MSPGSNASFSLAICSATTTASVALMRGREVVVELRASDDRQQAESLLPLIDEILRAQHVALADLGGFSLAIGPGSFTSLRIGFATVKGLAFGSDQPVAAVSTLRAMAAAVEGEGDRILVPMLDARREEVYAAAYTGAVGHWQPRNDVLAECVYTAAELAERLPQHALLVGEGVAIVGDELCDGLGPGIVLLRAEDLAEPRAAVVGRLGADLLVRGEGVPAGSLAPRYVRRAEAEVQRIRERFESLSS